MPTDDNTPPQSPDDFLRSGIKAAVSAANGALGEIEQSTCSVREPVNDVYDKAKKHSILLVDNAKYTYQRRREFAPQIVGGSALLGASIGWIRRGRIAGLLGGTITAGTAYTIVYDQIVLENIPNVIFGKKD